MKIHKFLLSILVFSAFFCVTKISLGLVGGTTPANTTNINNLQLDEYYIYDTSSSVKIDFSSGTVSLRGPSASQGNFTILSPADLLFGPSATSGVVTATATSGTSQGLGVFPVFLRASSIMPGAVEGSVLCSTDVTLGTGITADVCISVGGSQLNSVIGVALAAASTGTIVQCASYGWVLALTTGVVRAGDMLSTQSLGLGATGYLSATPSQVINATGTVAIALQAGNSAGGLTRVKLK